MKWLLRSPLHGLISNSFMLITFTGRKSGQTYTTPVNYVRDGDDLLVTSYRQRTWWRNLRGGAPVTVRVQGRDLEGVGEAITDDEGVAANLLAFLQKVPNRAKYFRVGLDANGQPNPEDVARSAQDRVVVRIRLAQTPTAVHGKDAATHGQESY
jgi:deazaflavin-dependent oxidoreductase (nitroreductase family)